MSPLFDILRKAEQQRKERSASGETGFQDAKDDGSMPENIKAVVLLFLVILAFSIAYYRFKASEANTAKPFAAVQTPVVVQAPIPPVVNPVPVALTPAVVHSVPAVVQAVPVVQTAPAVPQPVPKVYKLNGVIISGDNSFAIIDGKPVKLEGTIDSLILKKVLPDHVELLNANDNSTVVLKLDNDIN